jgi:hypothetical protein
MKYAITVLLLAPLAALHAAGFIVFDVGVAPAPIIVFKDAPTRTRDAAVTLAEYIEKISGVKPEVIDGEPQPLPERAIWIGVQPIVKALFPKTDFDFKQPEETLGSQPSGRSDGLSSLLMTCFSVTVLETFLSVLSEPYTSGLPVSREQARDC